MEIRLSLDGPHDDESIRRTAAAMAECVRVLNHATLPPNQIQNPATVNAVLGDLHETAARLNQLVQQLHDQLARMYDDGQIGDTGDQAGLNVAGTLIELEDAQARITALADNLRRAHNASSGLYLREDSES